MTEEVLDKIDKEEKTGSTLPFIFLCLGLLSFLAFPTINLIDFNIAGASLIINFVLILWARKTGIIFTGILAICASVNLINYFPFEIIAFGKPETLGFDYISALIFLGSYVLVNEKIFLEFRNNIVNSKTISSSSNSKVDFFKKRFEHKSQQELQSIVDNSSMTEDAKKAASELLE